MSRVQTPFPAPVNFFWRHSQVVRQRSAKPLSPVQIRVSPPVIYSAGVVELVDTRDLKSLEHLARAGSSPASGTKSGNSSVGRAQPCQG